MLCRFFREMWEALDGPKGGYFRALQNVRAGISDLANSCKDLEAVATNPESAVRIVRLRKPNQKPKPT